MNIKKSKRITNSKFSATNIKKVLLNYFKKYTFNKAISYANKFTLGNLNKAILDIYNEKYIDKLNDDQITSKSQEIIDNYGEAYNFFKTFNKNKKLDSREDTNKSTNIDKDSILLGCIFSGNDGKELVEIANTIKKQTQAASQFIETKQNNLDSDLRKVGLKNIDKKDKEILGPAISGMIEQGKSKNEIKKEIKQIKAESLKIYNKKLLLIESKNKLLKENKLILSEAFKTSLLIESVFMCEGFLDNIKTLVKNADVFYTKNLSDHSHSSTFNRIDIPFSKLINDLGGGNLARASIVYNFKQHFFKDSPKWNKVNFPGHVSQTVEKRVSETVKILKGGFNLGTLLSAWWPILIAATLTIVDKYKRQIRNIISANWKKFKNKKGVIAEMGFNTIPAENKKGYNLQFNIKDFKWRCLNQKNILHYPSKKIIKNCT